jgi:sarcosine oxidase
MAANYDVIIAGLGAMGSAAAFHLSRSGLRVLGLDRFAPPHALGSSHGQTRIIREAYFEHPVYVPMVQRAYALWHELEQLAREPLLLQTGGLMIGEKNGAVFGGAKRSAELHHLPHEVLSASEIRRRFPALRPEESMSGILEPRAGILFPERCIAAHLHSAARHGADLRYDEPVLSWSPVDAGVEVHTARGRYHAAQLVLSAGSWIQQLVPELPLPLTIERQVQFWFEPKHSPALFHPERCPIHLWQFDQRRFFYGFPDLGDGVKVACHHRGESTSPEEIRREVATDEVEGMREVVRRFLPAGDGPLRSAVVCMYTNTPDEHFWIDRHPGYPGVLIASPCSGHGFKFSSVIGEILSNLVIRGKSAFDLTLFGSRVGPVEGRPPL